MCVSVSKISDKPLDGFNETFTKNICQQEPEVSPDRDMFLVLFHKITLFMIDSPHFSKFTCVQEFIYFSPLIGARFIKTGCSVNQIHPKR